MTHHLLDHLAKLKDYLINTRTPTIYIDYLEITHFSKAKHHRLRPNAVTWRNFRMGVPEPQKNRFSFCH